MLEGTAGVYAPDNLLVALAAPMMGIYCRRRKVMLLFLVGLACADNGDPNSDPTASATLNAIFPGVAPWDGFRTNMDDHWVPELEDSSGEPVDLALLVMPGLWDGRWVGAREGELPAGDYVVTGLERTDQVTAFPFTVYPYGRDPVFDATILAPGAWALDFWDSDPDGLIAVALDSAEARLLLLVDEVIDGQAAFRLVYEDPDSACEALKGTSSLSTTGELNWEAHHREVLGEPSLVARDIKLHLGFSGDASTLAGAMGWAQVDLGDLSARMAEDQSPSYLCEAWEDLGGRCRRCGGGNGAGTCATLGFRRATGVRIEPPAYDELPDCQAEFEKDLLNECSCHSGLGAVWGTWIVGPLALARRRRRLNE